MDSHDLRIQQDKRQLKWAYWVSRIAAHGFLLLAATFTRPFDKSSQLAQSNWPHTLLRWDAFHFSSIALNGYTHEHQFAFFPGTPLLLRAGAEAGLVVMRLLGCPTPKHLSENNVLLAGSTISLLLCDWSSDLYDLSLQFSGSPSFALLSALLSLMPLSPATLLVAPYAEPFFATASFKGMLACAREKWLKAAFWFMIATAFRSNGILLAGYLVWGLVVKPVLKRLSTRERAFDQSILGGVLKAVFLSVIITLPFAMHQYHAYKVFCTGPFSEHTQPRPWCNNRLPLVYSFVQDHYWHVGFLKYWTMAQIPNFLFAGPVLYLLLSSSISHIRHIKTTFLQLPLAFSLSSWEWETLPYALHTLALSLIILFASHTQIALRLCSSLPYTYWAAAKLFGVGHEAGANTRKLGGRLWVWYTVVWGFISLVLWAAFLPPA